MWEVMFWPIAACVLLPWLLVYLGLHVVQRGIIFIDIAMAQMASLGICVAVLLNFEPESVMSYVIGLAVTLVGAAIFSATGKRASSDPTGSDYRNRLRCGGGRRRVTAQPFTAR